MDVPAVRAAMVYVLSVRTSVMLYSWFNTAAVMLPPKLAAPLNVTKSPDTAPCAVSVTVIVADPLLAAKRYVSGTGGRTDGCDVREATTILV